MTNHFWYYSMIQMSYLQVRRTIQCISNSLLILKATEHVDAPFIPKVGTTRFPRRCMVRGWCPSPRQGRPSGSKTTYKSIYIYLPLKALAGLEPEFSRIQDLSFYHQTKPFELNMAESSLHFRKNRKEEKGASSHGCKVKI
ncbi:hypothetical protein MTR_3g112200 [Medicago truncatula]|uniref:Uncharacterized protein n=1 Tax=Medicago truncatula TaxID=3880 RepID=A0A072V2C3_MEDTR|nr:hypothetical protein MTR_3g112200 [Medicago truncatula]